LSRQVVDSLLRSFDTAAFWQFRLGLLAASRQVVGSERVMFRISHGIAPLGGGRTFTYTTCSLRYRTHAQAFFSVAGFPRFEHIFELRFAKVIPR